MLGKENHGLKSHYPYQYWL